MKIFSDQIVLTFITTLWGRYDLTSCWLFILCELQYSFCDCDIHRHYYIHIRASFCSFTEYLAEFDGIRLYSLPVCHLVYLYMFTLMPVIAETGNFPTTFVCYFRWVQLFSHGNYACILSWIYQFLPSFEVFMSHSTKVLGFTFFSILYGVWRAFCIIRIPYHINIELISYVLSFGFPKNHVILVGVKIFLITIINLQEISEELNT